MNIFETVKASVTTRMAAERYGLRVERGGMTCCPFHGDCHPSMKVDDRYYCFSCHETGDVIDFTGRLFNLPPLDAAKKLAADFGIDPNTPNAAEMRVPPILSEEKRRRAQQADCMTVMIDYERYLKEQKEKFVPKTAEEEWDRRFISACNTLPSVTDVIDTLFSLDDVLNTQMVNHLQDSGTLQKIRSFLERHETQQPGIPDTSSAA